ncbi:hypothetical protein [Novipirellula artificiosorum]|uniref:Uncharacterized protein n=1 Tax=Novipirellula artificiosorum TaxID=2528016 RepID=A0A5C6DT66_9BACT|nr:hypothetical protein [Novipirellula artificiosorum]TWU39384.1 hypothetical protein Poly41_22080 [Novipirellula artificiosorum]
MDSFERVTVDEPRGYFAQACFDNFEQDFIPIAWWNRLRERNRIGIERRFNANGLGQRPYGMDLDPMFKLV